MTIEKARQRVFDTCNLQTGDIEIYDVLYRYKVFRDMTDAELEHEYDLIAERLGFMR